MAELSQRLQAALADHYRLERELEPGGMALVFLAEDLRHRRRVAIKVLNPEVAAAIGPDRFLREIEAAARLTHPHILPLFDSGAADGLLYYVMPYVEGGSLRQRLQREKQLPVEAALAITREVADALDHAHRHGVVHRDIKPENILFEERHALVADFGLARLVASSQADTRAVTLGGRSLTGEGATVGTPQYMSPEQAAGSRELDGRSDQYSLACVLYEMLAGVPPFTGATVESLVHQHLSVTPRPVMELRPAVPASVAAAVAKALAKTPADRYTTAAQLAVALPAAAREEHVTGRRGHWVALTLASVLVALAALIGGGLLLIRSSDRPDARRPTSAPRVTPFLVGDAIERNPSWNPASNLVAYVSDEAGDDDVWISDAEGANRVNLTDAHEGIDDWPVWSPDGQRIAFYSERDGPGIYTMTALGGEVRKHVAVSSGVHYTFSLAWAKNNTLIYTDFDSAGNKQVYAASLVAGRPVCLTCRLGVTEGQAGDLSPSGHLLLFKSGESGPFGELFLGDTRTGGLTTVEQNIDRARWAPDGRSILFVSGREGLADLWELPIDPVRGTPVGEARRITSGLGLTDYAVNGAGNRILAVKAKSNSSIWQAPPGVERVAKLADSGRMTFGDFLDRRPRWVPRSQSFVFESNRRGSLDIWRQDPGGREPFRLTSSQDAEHRPRPAPNGKWIAFDVASKAGQFVHLMRSDGSDVHPLRPGTAPRTCCADWSPDGTRLAFTAWTILGYRIGVAAMDTVTGAIGRVAFHDAPGTGEEYPRWSPDGRFIVFESNLEGHWDLWIMNAEGRNPRRLTADPGNERSAAWTADGRAVLYVKDYRAVWRLAVDTAGSATKRATMWYGPPPRTRLPADDIDPGEAGTLIALVREASDIWLVELPKK